MSFPHSHGEDGSIILPEPPEVTEVAEAASASIRIAEVNAQRDITLARIQARMSGEHDETEVETLRAELRALQAIVAPPQAEPEQEPEPAPPIVVEAAPVAEEPDELAPPPQAEDHQADEPAEPRKSSRGLGMWS